MMFRMVVLQPLAVFTLIVATLPVSAAELVPVSFRNDVIPILTRHACNSGGCHGKSTGQNGFRLSLLGFEPDFDYRALVLESRGRRVFASTVNRSLILAKATGSVPHGGGRRIDPDSEDYRVLVEWIRKGAPDSAPNEPQLTGITVTPPQSVMSTASKIVLKVTAHYADGRQQDVTGRSLYESNSPEIGDVDRFAQVTTSTHGGLFAVMVRFGSQIAVFRGTVPFPHEADFNLDAALTAARVDPDGVDQHLIAQWKTLNVAPSPVATDASFIRRATLDICGTLPTSAEVTAYVDDSSIVKKSTLIDRLLERPEHASYFALKWADILQNRGRSYASRHQREGTTLLTEWVRDSIAANKPYDRFVSEILTATGSQQQNPPTIWYRSVRTTQDYVESVAQAFLGVRIQCAQCHHHPAERWSQGDYYSFAANFARVGRKGGFADAEIPTSEIIFLKDHGEVVHPRTGDVMHPRPLGGPDFNLTRYDDPRRALAKWMTSPENPFFARTLANRMWGHFLGRGIVHPIDDSRSTNPPSNPAMLDELARELVESGYDVRHLIRVITNSAAYGLSSEPTAHNKDDIQSFARFPLRRLSAEVLLDGLSQVLEVPTEFAGGPGKFPVGTRAIELPDENVPTSFLDVFGRPGRTSACECERSDDPALAQALELVNSKEIQKKLTAKDGYVARLSTNENSHAANVREIFLKVFAREARSEESDAAIAFLESEPDRAEAYRTLMWSLLATNEFLFNH
ncbi:MAG: DUF1553 domain-containing protein [Rhodopirellula sp.]|nr:DUF1553 domain-containing protein [Rhodopirellula sp.]